MKTFKSAHAYNFEVLLRRGLKGNERDTLLKSAPNPYL